MKPFVFIAALTLLLAACGKDRFETKPQLKIKSVNTSDNELAFNQTLSITMEYTDKEGDVSDSLYIFRQRLNSRDPQTLLPLPYKLPEFPSAPKGELEINLGFQNELTLNLPPIRIPGTSSSYEKDTMRLKFVAKDLGGNYSDTVVLDNLIVERR